jgi:hypothetical protein
MVHQIAIGCSDSTIRIFDRRMLGTKATGTMFLKVVLQKYYVIFSIHCSFLLQKLIH